MIGIKRAVPCIAVELSTITSCYIPGVRTRSSSPFTLHGGSAGMAKIRLPPPDPFDFRNPDDWRRWKRRFQQFREASGLSGESASKKISTLLYSTALEKRRRAFSRRRTQLLKTALTTTASWRNSMCTST